MDPLDNTRIHPECYYIYSGGLLRSAQILLRRSGLLPWTMAIVTKLMKDCRRCSSEDWENLKPG